MRGGCSDTNIMYGVISLVLLSVASPLSACQVSWLAGNSLVQVYGTSLVMSYLHLCMTTFTHMPRLHLQTLTIHFVMYT